jgi:hypothetical protein
MNTKIQAAAKRLLESGSITKEECEELSKIAAIPALASALGKFKAFGGETQKVVGTLAGIGLIGMGVKKFLVDPFVQEAQMARSYNDMTTKVPSLQGKDPQQLADYFDVVKSYSPRAASNPLVAGALVNKMIEFGGVDHKLVKDIADIQGNETLFSSLKDISGMGKDDKKDK